MIKSVGHPLAIGTLVGRHFPRPGMATATLDVKILWCCWLLCHRSIPSSPSEFLA